MRGGQPVGQSSAACARQTRRALDVPLSLTQPFSPSPPQDNSLCQRWKASSRCLSGSRCGVCRAGARRGRDVGKAHSSHCAQGILGKLGGGAGGHKNWKNRYFVLTDHLAYYTDQATFAKDPTKTLGVISLNCFFCSKMDGAESNDFQVNAYPKSLVLRAANADERQAWIDCIMQPLADMMKPPAQVRQLPLDPRCRPASRTNALTCPAHSCEQSARKRRKPLARQLRVLQPPDCHSRSVCVVCCSTRLQLSVRTCRDAQVAKGSAMHPFSALVPIPPITPSRLACYAAVDLGCVDAQPGPVKHADCTPAWQRGT